MPESRISKTVRIDLAAKYLHLAGIKHVCNILEWMVLKDTRKSV
jgi:hypothetical protein